VNAPHDDPYCLEKDATIADVLVSECEPKRLCQLELAKVQLCDQDHESIMLCLRTFLGKLPLVGNVENHEAMPLRDVSFILHLTIRSIVNKKHEVVVAVLHQ
jgi:hypothetical protein